MRLLLSDMRSLAERNEDINRRRIAKQSNSAPLKVTNPEAFSRFLSQVTEQDEKQKTQQRDRELERANREGINYKSVDERKQEARLAKIKHQEEEGTRQTQGKFDPYKNYYQILGIDRASSSQEVKKAYKKLALAFHPDKQRHTSEEQLEAIHLKFQDIREAFDVLSDEELRVLYDRVRDYMDVHGNKAIPPLSPEDSALMRSGMGELSRLRRQGVKLKKHTTRIIEVLISLRKLNSGCIKTTTVTRQRIDDHGLAFSCSKSFHLIIRKGAPDGMQIPFENEGDETLDTHPGDLIFILRQKPHLQFKRIGVKDLEMRCPAAEQLQVWYLIEVTTLYGHRYLVQFSPIEESLKAGGKGGVYELKIAKEGLHDPLDPWEQSQGVLFVKVRFPPVLDPETPLLCFVHYPPLLAIGCCEDWIGGTAAGITVSNRLRQSQKNAKQNGEKLTSFNVVCLQLDDQSSVAASGVFDALAYALPSLKASAIQLQLDHESLILDDEFAEISKAHVMVLDMNYTSQTDTPLSRDVKLRTELQDSGLWDLFIERRLSGTIFIAIDNSCSLLGLEEGHANSFLPYLVRSGGGNTGWRELYTTLLQMKDEVEGVGIMKGATLLIDGVSFEAEEIIAPTKDMVAQTRLANLDFGYQSSYQYEENIHSRGFNEHCSKACLFS